MKLSILNTENAVLNISDNLPPYPPAKKKSLNHC